MSTLSNESNKCDLSSPPMSQPLPSNFTKENHYNPKTTKSQLTVSEVKGNSLTKMVNTLNILHILSTASGRKRKRCGICHNCTRPECGECKYCKDKPKYGGPGRLKQCCDRKKCQGLITHDGNSSQNQKPPQTKVNMWVNHTTMA